MNVKSLTVRMAGAVSASLSQLLHYYRGCSRSPEQASCFRVQPRPAQIDRSALNALKRRILYHINLAYQGRDFNNEEPLDVSSQVGKLIEQATSLENLCQCFHGWFVLFPEVSASVLTLCFTGVRFGRVLVFSCPYLLPLCHLTLVIAL
jgi:hypothetical protein